MCVQERKRRDGLYALVRLQRRRNQAWLKWRVDIPVVRWAAGGRSTDGAVLRTYYIAIERGRPLTAKLLWGPWRLCKLQRTGSMDACNRFCHPLYLRCVQQPSPCPDWPTSADQNRGMSE